LKKIQQVEERNGPTNKNQKPGALAFLVVEKNVWMRGGGEGTDREGEKKRLK